MMRPYYEKTFDRHYKDLEDVKSGKKSYLRFNEKLGLRYIKIIESLKHYKGDLAGKLLKLEDWQKKILLIAFGWERLDSENDWVRRFSIIFIFIPRKNGKTILASGMAIADMIIREEIGGEVVIFATKRDQAKLCWTGCDKMLKSQRELKAFTKTAYSKINFNKSDTTITTLGRDSDTEDGLNVSIGVADERHAHPDNSLWDVIRSSQGARKQPVMISITTAGFNTASPAYQDYEYAKKILDGVLEDDSFFAFIAEASKKDDPYSEKTWIKANPNYGVSISKDYMEQVANEAKARPDRENNFLVKNLNIWTNTAESFISFEKWKKCGGEMIDFDNLEDERFVLGIDGSFRDDFTALVKVLRRGKKYFISPSFYIPKIYATTLRERELNAPLLGWIKQGFIKVIDKDFIDVRILREEIDEYIDKIEMITPDISKIKQLIMQLREDGYDEKIIEIFQSPKFISSPTNLLLRLVNDGDLVHDNNPVLNWMISNFTIVTNRYGEIAPQKQDHNRKIDGVAAIINALAYYEFVPRDEPKVSIYETRGMRIL